MSNSNSSSTFTSTSFSTFSSNVNGRQTSYTERTHTDPSGTTVHRVAQEPGQEKREERLRFPGGGQAGRVEGGNERRIEDVTDKEDEYVERMEGEYAKREGGA